MVIEFKASYIIIYVILLIFIAIRFFFKNSDNHKMLDSRSDKSHICTYKFTACIVYFNLS